MTLGELIQEARSRLDDEAVQAGLWSDTLLTRYANEAEKEATRRADLLIDRTDPTYCRVELIAEKPDYSRNAKVLRVLEAYLGPSVVKDTISWTAATRTLADTGNGFLKAGFKADTPITVYGFTTAGNNGRFTISSVTAGSIVVVESGMTDEAATPTVTVKGPKFPLKKKSRMDMDIEFGTWSDTRGEPQFFITDIGTELVVFPIPTEANVLDMIVSRLPKTAMSDLTTHSPEIQEEYHFDLVDWMCHLAFMKRDSDSFDAQLATSYENSFTKTFGPRPSANAEQDRRSRPRPRSIRPREFGF
jgi:hypothetical protein